MLGGILYSEVMRPWHSYPESCGAPALRCSKPGWMGPGRPELVRATSPWQCGAPACPFGPSQDAQCHTRHPPGNTELPNTNTAPQTRGRRCAAERVASRRMRTDIPHREGRRAGGGEGRIAHAQSWKPAGALGFPPRSR